jgi:hypothetical protein
LSQKKLPGFDIDLNDAPSFDALSEVEAHYGLHFPADYRRFMASADGCSGFAGDQYVVLWRATELVQFNREYELEAEGGLFLAFGGNGAGEGFAFDLRDDAMRIVMIPFMDPKPVNAIAVSQSFDDMFSCLARGVFSAASSLGSSLDRS